MEKLLTQFIEELRKHPEEANDREGNTTYYWFRDILGDDIEIRVKEGGSRP